MSTVDYVVAHPEKVLSATQQTALLSLALRCDDDQMVAVVGHRHQTLHALNRRGLISSYGGAVAIVTARGLKAAIRLAQVLR